MAKTALINGASSGIGLATAKKLAESGINLIITARRKDKIEALAKELIEKYKVNVLTLTFDIRSYDEVKNAIESLPSEWADIDILVNNAGLAVGLAPIHKGEVDDWERMIDTNIKGLLYITRLVTPRMVERKTGHIINLSSIAGKHTYPNGNVYCATKHAVDSLSKAMRLDLLDYNIKVTQICPGAVETEFSIVRFKGDESRAKQVYDGYESLVAEDIAEAISFAVSAPAHVDIQDMLIMPTAQANGNTFHREK